MAVQACYRAKHGLGGFHRRMVIGIQNWMPTTIGALSLKN
jgi:hypothetical protein